MGRIDLTGMKFGRLTVVKYLGSIRGKTTWLCKCDCGNWRNATSYPLINGISKSCGCAMHDKLYKGDGGRKRQPLYLVYCSIKSRCYNPNNHSYNRYGRRGIKVSPEWDDYENFKSWALANGYRTGLTVDRIDNNDDYSPRNCRLVTLKEQQRNRRDNVHIVVDGKDYLATDIAKMCRVSTSTISRWVKAGIIQEKIKNGKDTSHNKGRKIKHA